ncbi:MAG: BON domain-containing protein [Gammaproteobacteria bacterium]|nr:BON domain-containing protein [Gammaproteobacteria bacterium]MDH3414372.1 BON domain-containing protein [Gammaproteobacteria bacterium]
MSITKKLLFFAIIAAQTALLGGCVAAVGAGVVTGAAVAYDRRSAGTFVDDELIELKSIGALQDDSELWNYSHISVTSFNNIVLLTGECPSEALRQRAAEIVAKVQKVRKVHNEIIIAAPTSMMSRSEDTVLTGKVKTALLNKEDLEATRVKVVTEDGVVYLMGLVTQKEADAATEVTRRVGGVKRVVRIFEYIDT